MEIALGIGAFGVIAGQLVLIVWLVHKGFELYGDVRSVETKVHDRDTAIVARDAALGERDRIIQDLQSSNVRMGTVVKTVENQRDEALHELSMLPDPTGRATAARIRSRLSNLSALSGSGDPRPNTDGGG